MLVFLLIAIAFMYQVQLQSQDLLIRQEEKKKILVEYNESNISLYNSLKKPTFLIGFYNDFDDAFINKEFNLTLNNQVPIKISKTIPEIIPYKKFPFYNEWMSYYLVEFNTTKKPFILIYKSKHWGEVNLTF